MVFIFLAFLAALIAVYFRRRTWAIGFVLAGLLLSLGLFWQHLTTVLKINL